MESVIEKSADYNKWVKLGKEEWSADFRRKRHCCPDCGQRIGQQHRQRCFIASGIVSARRPRL